jgi:hypothetical protein
VLPSPRWTYHPGRLTSGMRRRTSIHTSKGTGRGAVLDKRLSRGGVAKEPRESGDEVCPSPGGPSRPTVCVGALPPRPGSSQAAGDPRAPQPPQGQRVRLPLTPQAIPPPYPGLRATGWSALTLMTVGRRAGGGADGGSESGKCRRSEQCAAWPYQDSPVDPFDPPSASLPGGWVRS